MLDLYSLARLNRTAAMTAESEYSAANWSAADGAGPRANTAFPTTNADAATYSRDFLLGYLKHYCRLSDKLDRPGTIPVLQALLELEPDNGEVHFWLARQYERDGQLEEAFESYERAANLCLDKPTYMLAATRVACLLGERGKGLALVCSVISAYPTMAEAYYERGLIFETDENWRRALRDYEMCSRLEPQNPAYLCAVASMYRHLKLFKVARRCAAKALKIDPHYAPAHEELRQIPFFDQLFDFSSKAADETQDPNYGRQSSLLMN